MRNFKYESGRFDMKYCLVVIGFIFFVFSGCNENRKDNQVYLNTPIKIVENNIEIKTSLQADQKNGELTLFMKVKNNSGKAIMVDYLFCNISLNEERGVIAEPRQTYKDRLTPGDQEHYEIVYHPINSLELYNRMGYRGDLRHNYILKPDFIKDEEGRQLVESTIIFEMSDQTFSNYKSAYGQNNTIQLFDLTLDRDSFITQQKEFLKKITAPTAKDEKSGSDSLLENVILISKSDVIIENRVFKFSGYKQDETLFMNMSIINMGLHKLKVRLDTFCLNALGHTYFPGTIQSEFFSYNQIVDSTLILKQGARFNFLLKYSIPTKMDTFKLTMNWLQIQNHTGDKKEIEFSKLFGKELLFTSSSANLDN